MNNGDIRNQYETETGKEWVEFPATHGERGYASWLYQAWLEERLIAASILRNQSLPVEKGIKTIARDYALREYNYLPDEETETLTHKSILESAELDFIEGYRFALSSQLKQPEKGDNK